MKGNKHLPTVLVSLVILSLVVSACGPAATPAPQVIKETVVVTKEVEKVVTQEVEKVVTKEVEKVVIATPVPMTKVNVCFSAASGTMSPAWYAFENDLFEKYNLDVNLVYISSGSKAASAMIAGQVEFCQIAGSAVVNAVVAGEDLVLIGGLFNTYVYQLMVTPDIKTAEDLKGKAVAISKPGSSSDAAIRAAIESLGLKPDDEVAILAVGSQPERVAAMETGAVAGTVVSVPETIEAKEQGYITLVDMAELGIPFQHTALATTRSYIEQNPEAVTNFTKAMVEAIALMKEDKEGTMEVMAEYMLLDVEEDAPSLTEAYDVLILGFLPKVPYPTLDGVQTLLTKRAKKDPKAAEVKPEDVTDLSFVKELEDSGFIDALYK
ncbi:MAG: ABC transporter substrate-binding protein [Anaerolineae bacterium]|nr:ABC transporter substrate-binding protein [Anaerolineae bacterium]